LKSAHHNIGSFLISNSWLKSSEGITRQNQMKQSAVASRVTGLIALAHTISNLSWANMLFLISIFRVLFSFAPDEYIVDN
jgi:hypothetical protein